MNSITDEKNFLAIKRLDQFATELITKSTNASVYEFDMKTGDWVKANIEGSLFIYRRLDKPFYSIIVANKNSRNDFILPITNSLGFKYMPPYIYMFTRSGANSETELIKALFLYGEDECKRIFDVLVSLQKQKPSLSTVTNELVKLSISKENHAIIVDASKNKANKKANTKKAKEASAKEQQRPSGATAKASKSKESVKKSTKEQALKGPSTSVKAAELDEMAPKKEAPKEKAKEVEPKWKPGLPEIQGVDVFADEVLTRTFYAQVRDFDSASQKYGQSDAAGEMFIYRRLDRPLYSIIVFDKEGNSRFVQPITTALKFKYQDPNLHMYDRSGLNKALYIFCTKERKRISKALTQIQKSLHAVSKEVHKDLKFSEP